MYPETSIVWNAFMSSEDGGISKGSPEYAMIMNGDVRDEIAELCRAGHLGLAESAAALYIYPVSDASPYLADANVQVVRNLKSQTREVARIHMHLANFICIAFMSLFYNNETVGYRNSRAFISNTGIIAEIDKILGEAVKNEGEGLGANFISMAKAWDALSLISRTEGEGKIYVSATTKSGVVEGVMRYMRENGLVRDIRGEAWEPTERLDALIPIVFQDERYRAAIAAYADGLEGGRYA